MTKRKAYKRIGLGFLVSFVLYTIGYWMNSDAIMTAAFFAGYVVSSWGISNLAEAKGHDGGIYFFYSLVTTLFIGIVIVWLLPDVTIKPSDTAEQKLRRMKELGVIDRMPDDPEAAMEKVQAFTRLGNEWTASIASQQGLIGNDGFPVYDKVYPLAIEHFTRANGCSLSESDRKSVTKAAQHFGAYWRSDGRFPKEDSGEPDWWEIYGQIQDHFRQWTHNMIQ